MTALVGTAGCGPERPPAPGSYASVPAQRGAPAGRPDLPADAYRLEWGEVALPATLKPGGRVAVPVTITNTSPVTWPASGQGEMYVVRLGHRWLWADGQVLADYGTTRSELPAPLPPGRSVIVPAAVVAPSAPGEYTVQFDLVHEGVTWFAARGAAKKLVKVSVRD